LALPATPAAFPKAFYDAWMARDLVGLSVLFAADADYLTSSGAWWESRDAITKGLEAGFRAEFQRARMVTGRSKLRSLSPELALLHQRFVLTGHLLPDGREAARYTLIFAFVLQQTGAGWQALSVQVIDVIT